MIADSFHCCGCGACKAVCPSGAIELSSDSFGFSSAKINASQCINCGRCGSVCPVLNMESRVIPKKVYAIRAREASLLGNAASGGAFAIMARSVLLQGGVVIGAGWSHQGLRVVHKAIYKVDDIPQLQGSKYVQSDMTAMFQVVKKALSEGKRVLFSGTPCQTLAMHRYFENESRNLYLVSLICYGIPSAMVFEAYKTSLEKRCGSKVTKFSFRKRVGSAFQASYEFANHDKDFNEPYSASPYSRALFNNLSIRYSCSNCPARNGRSAADVQIGDCWHPESFALGMADDGGLSAVLALSDKGVSLVESLDCDRCTIHYEDVLRYNPMLESNPRLHRKRKDFLLGLTRGEDFSLIVEKFLKQPLYKRVLSKIKLVFQ